MQGAVRTLCAPQPDRSSGRPWVAPHRSGSRGQKRRPGAEMTGRGLSHGDASGASAPEAPVQHVGQLVGGRTKAAGRIRSMAGERRDVLNVGRMVWIPNEGHRRDVRPARVTCSQGGPPRGGGLTTSIESASRLLMTDVAEGLAVCRSLDGDCAVRASCLESVVEHRARLRGQHGDSAGAGDAEGRCVRHARPLAPLERAWARLLRRWSAPHRLASGRSRRREPLVR